MGKVMFHHSVSLDGFVAGPNDGPDNPLGDGGDALFRWYFSGDVEVNIPGAPPMKLDKRSAEVFQEGIKSIGAMICGRRMFDIARAWGGGVRLFANLGDRPIDLEVLRVVEAPGATHLSYRVCR